MPAMQLVQTAAPVPELYVLMGHRRQLRPEVPPKLGL